MSDYEKERDEAMSSRFIMSPLNWKLGADWANARSEKEIEVIKEMLTTTEKMLDAANEQFASDKTALQSQLTQCHAMIEKMEEALEYYKDCDQFLSEASFDGRRVIQCEDGIDAIAIDALQSLSEFKKSMNEGVK